MNTSNISRHAQKRMQQRAVSEQALAQLLAYGSVSFHKGVELYFMDKQAQRRLRTEQGCVGNNVRRSGADPLYAVVANGNVVTVARRRKRLKRNRNSGRKSIKRS